MVSLQNNSVTHLPNQLQYWNVPRKTQENVNLFCSVVMDLTQYLLSNSKNVNASSQELTNEKDSRIVNVSGFRWYGVYVPYCYKFQKILKIQVRNEWPKINNNKVHCIPWSPIHIFFAFSSLSYKSRFNKNLYILIKS